MYSAQKLKDQIKIIAAQKNILIKQLMSNCDLNINTLSQMTDKKGLSCFSLAKIADCLDCSVDYLLGRESQRSVSVKNVHDNVGVVGQANAPVTIHNGTERSLTTHEKDLIRIYNECDGKKQMKLMQFAYELEEEI